MLLYTAAIIPHALVPPPSPLAGLAEADAYVAALKTRLSATAAIANTSTSPPTTPRTPPHCHSHNDYASQEPLFGALRAGCDGVEADVWRLDTSGTLYVGHHAADLRPARTLRRMYVMPMRRILDGLTPAGWKPRGNARRGETRSEAGSPQHPGLLGDGRSVVLLIDVKTAAASTVRTVLAALAPLRDRGYLTTYSSATGELVERPVTAVLSGFARLDDVVEADAEAAAGGVGRDVFLDAPLARLSDDRDDNGDGSDSGRDEPARYRYNATNSLYASASFSLSIGRPPPGAWLCALWPPWRERRSWAGWSLAHSRFNPSSSSSSSPSDAHAAEPYLPATTTPCADAALTAPQLSRLHAQLDAAHVRGLRARYWGVPGVVRGAVEEVLVREGVDVLNVDRPGVE